MAYDWPDGPLPPREPNMQLATEECFDHLRPDSFKPLSEGLEVRETSIAKVTGGAVGVKVFRAVPGAKQRGIPWHWHELGCHVSYVTRGWAVYEFEGIPGSVRIEAGCFIYQPPYNRHRELEQSEDFEAMEFTFPGNFNSVIMQYDEESKDWQYSNVTIG
jgi:quercetin dioxygenase-like cupin family protein